MKINFKAMSWCWENGVKIFPHPITQNGSVLQIVISKNENEKLGEQRYTPQTVYKKINELYTSIYNKNNPNEEIQ